MERAASNIQQNPTSSTPSTKGKCSRRRKGAANGRDIANHTEEKPSYMQKNGDTLPMDAPLTKGSPSGRDVNHTEKKPSYLQKDGDSLPIDAPLTKSKRPRKRRGVQHGDSSPHQAEQKTNCTVVEYQPISNLCDIERNVEQNINALESMEPKETAIQRAIAYGVIYSNLEDVNIDLFTLEYPPKKASTMQTDDLLVLVDHLKQYTNSLINKFKSYGLVRNHLLFNKQIDLNLILKEEHEDAEIVRSYLYSRELYTY